MPLKLAEEFVFLRHAPCVTLSEERLIVPRLRGGAREPQALVAQGAQFRLEPWLALKAGREPRNRVQTLVDQEYEARARPRVPSRGGGRAQARPNTLAGGYAQAYPMGIAPKPPGDLGRVGLGVSRSGTFDPEA
jgi:hypothetical protein